MVRELEDTAFVTSREAKWKCISTEFSAGDKRRRRCLRPPAGHSERAVRYVDSDHTYGIRPQGSRDRRAQ